MTQSTPGWVGGELPTPAQWNALFGGKVDAQMVAGQTVQWGTGALGFLITQRVSDGLLAISTVAGTPLFSLDLNGNIICAGSLTTNATP